MCYNWFKSVDMRAEARLYGHRAYSINIVRVCFYFYFYFENLTATHSPRQIFIARVSCHRIESIDQGQR